MKIVGLLKRLIVVSVAIMLAFLVLIMNLFLWFGLTVYAGRDGSNDLPVECGIVFGAAVRFDGTAGPSSRRRAETAAELYTNGQIERVFFTGGRGDGMLYSEAQVMKNVAVDAGVDTSDTILEEEARSTWENLLYTKPLIQDCSSVVAISDGYHLARIRLIASKQGWGELQTYPSSEKPTLRSELNNLLRETLGIGYYSFF